MWHKPCRTFNPWCLCIKTRCLFVVWLEIMLQSSCWWIETSWGPCHVTVKSTPICANNESGYDTIYLLKIFTFSKCSRETPQIAKFIGPTWGPPGSSRPQVGPMLAPWTLLSGTAWLDRERYMGCLVSSIWDHSSSCVISLLYGVLWCSESGYNTARLINKLSISCGPIYNTVTAWQ